MTSSACLDFVDVLRIADYLERVGDCLRWTGVASDPALRANCTWTIMDTPSCGNSWCVNARHWRKQIDFISGQGPLLAKKLQSVVATDFVDLQLCWLTSKKQLWFQGGLHRVRDLVWRYVTGVPLPAYARVRTKCRNPDCVNPYHVLAGQALNYGTLDVAKLSRGVPEKSNIIITPVKLEKKNRKFR